MRIALYILYIFTNTFPRWYHPMDGDMFCKFQAVSMVFLVLAGTKTKADKAVRDCAVLLTFGNAIDEVFGTPQTNSIVELLFAATVVLWTIYRLNKCRQKTSI